VVRRIPLSMVECSGRPFGAHVGCVWDGGPAETGGGVRLAPVPINFRDGLVQRVWTQEFGIVVRGIF